MIDLGIYTDKQIDIIAYHDDNEYISSSGLKQFMISPKHYEHMLTVEQERKSYFDFGNIFELMLLEPERMDEKVYVIDDKQMVELIGGKRPTATKAYKEWYADEVAKAGDRYMIKATGDESMETIQTLLDACAENTVINAITKNIQYQSSVFWKDEASGVLCKTRPDVVHVNKRIVIDIKTTLSAAPGAFARQAAKLNYPMQCALQMRGVIQGGMMDAVDLYYYIVVEKGAPNNVQLYRMTEEDIALANDKLDDALILFKLYKEGKLRKGYDFRSDNKHGILDLKIPQYYWYD